MMLRWGREACTTSRVTGIRATGDIRTAFCGLGTTSATLRMPAPRCCPIKEVAHPPIWYSPFPQPPPLVSTEWRYSTPKRALMPPSGRCLPHANRRKGVSTKITAWSRLPSSSWMIVAGWVGTLSSGGRRAPLCEIPQACGCGIRPQRCRQNKPTQLDGERANSPNQVIRTPAGPAPKNYDVTRWGGSRWRC